MTDVRESSPFTILTDPPRCQDPADGPFVVYGLAGDPPHRGHLDAIRWLAERAGRVIVVLSAAHAFGKAMAPYAQRRAWLDRLLDELPEALRPRVLVSDVEQRLLAVHPEARIYSIDVMLQLQTDHLGHRWAWGFGPDNANPTALHRFHRWAEIAAWPVWCVPEGSPWRSTQVRALLETHDRPALIDSLGAPLARTVLDWACTDEGQAWLVGRHSA